MTGGRQRRPWPVLLIAAPAAVAIWSGWIGLGALCGFGIVHPLPGIVPGFKLDTSITLPVGVEAYGAIALGAWLRPSGVPESARQFAKRSAIGALALGMLGQVAYHLLAAVHAVRAPWLVVVLVSCMPVVTLGFATALTHKLHGGPDPGHGQEAGPDRSAGPGHESVPDGPPVPRRATRPALTGPVPSPVSDRSGPEHARAAYRASVTAGAPLSGRALAERHSISRRQAARIIGEADGAPALSVVGRQ